MVGPVTNSAGNETEIAVSYQIWSEMEKFAADYTWAHEGKGTDVPALAMFCVALRRKTYEELGSRDEPLGTGTFEDLDYAQEMGAAGLRVICAADVFVHHIERAGSDL